MTNFDRILSEARELLTEEERLKLSLELVPDERDPKVEAAWIAESHRGTKSGRQDASKRSPLPKLSSKCSADEDDAPERSAHRAGVNFTQATPTGRGRTSQKHQTQSIRDFHANSVTKPLQDLLPN